MPRWRAAGSACDRATRAGPGPVGFRLRSGMNSAPLVGAIGLPVAGALVALLIPTGEGRRPSRRKRRKQDAEAPSGEAAVQTVAEPEPDPERAVRAGSTARMVVRAAALASAGLWIAVTLLGRATAGAATATGVVGPAAAAAALLLAAVPRPQRRLPAALGALGLALLGGGLALAAGTASAALAFAMMAAGAVVLVLASRDEPVFGPAALGLAGLASIAAGLARLAATTDSFTLPAGERLGSFTGVLLVLGATAVVVAGALAPRRPLALLLPLGLALGVPAAAALSSGGDVVAVLWGLGAVAAMAGWAARPDAAPGGIRLLVVALALGAMAAAAVPAPALPGSSLAAGGVTQAGVPAGWLLAAASVVTAIVLVPVAALAALPGLASLLVVLVPDPEPARLLLGALAVTAATIAALALRRPASVDGNGDRDGDRDGDRIGPLLAGLPALAAAAWLLFAPQTWAWAGEANLDRWPTSMAVAVAAGLAAAVAAGATGRLAVPDPPRLVAPEPVAADLESAGSGSAGARRLAVLAGAGLGLALVALLASSERIL